MSGGINNKPYDKLWALLSVDKNGNEGICALNTPIGPQVAVTGETRLLEIFIKETKNGHEEAKQANVKIVVAEFTRTGTRDV